MRSTFGRARQRGLSLVELLIGIAIGFFVLAATIVLVVGFGGENRRLLLEARLNQDMRAAMDIVTREVRRAGYWENAKDGAWFLGQVGTPVPYEDTNYATITVPSSSEITYNYSKDTDNTTSANEQFGFRLSGDTLQMNIGGGYQDLTDSTSTRVTGFSVQPRTPAQVINIACVTTCTVNCPTLEVREYTITMTAEASGDSAVTRTMRSDIRVRNDRTTGACPT